MSLPPEHDQTPDPSAYDAEWRRNPHHSRGPVAVRQHYHGEPDPEFVGLCDEADRRGLRVELAVGRASYGPEGREYRHLKELTVADPQGQRSVVWVPVAATDSIGTVATLARRKLERT